MPIDPDALMRFPIPSVRQRVTPRDAALYALSIGIGADPMDPDQIRFVDPLAGPAVVPAMVLVLAHPGFWLGDPASGVVSSAMLHGSQRFELFAPVEIDSEVESRSRVAGVIDKGPGKAAIIRTVTELTDAGGRRLARLDRTTFVRDGGGFGGTLGEVDDTPPPREPSGDPDAVVELPTAPNQALLYRLNGDLNALHSDPALAARAGFARPILHGLCTLGLVAHALLRDRFAYRPERMGAVSVRFAAPVFPGETIRTEIWRDGSFRARVVERDVVVCDHGRCDAMSEMLSR